MSARLIYIAFLFLSLVSIAWPQTGETRRSFLVIDTTKLDPSGFPNQSLKFIVTAAETGGSMTVFETTELPGYKTPWHRHDNCEETFYVLEGTLTVKSGDKTYRATAGSFVYIARGTPHGQGNFSDKPVRFITTVTPGGIEALFRERNEMLKNVSPTDPTFASRLDAIRDKYKFWLVNLGAWEPSSKP